MVRDVVTRAVVAHFRAHTAPLALLHWDPAGSLLITASVHGHNINVFQAGTLHGPCACTAGHCSRLSSYAAHQVGASTRRQFTPGRHLSAPA